MLDKIRDNRGVGCISRGVEGTEILQERSTRAIYREEGHNTDISNTSWTYTITLSQSEHLVISCGSTGF